jgi:hypothetical protein
MSFGNVMCSEIAMAVETMTAVPGGVEGSDLSRATRLAIRLETSFGFGSLGLVCLADDLDNRDLLLFDRLRAAVEATIDRAAREHRIC